jgi:hypothetical protein
MVKTKMARSVLLNRSTKNNYAEVGEIAPNPKRRKTNPGHKVHSSKAYNAKISRVMPSDISGVRNQWPGKAT